MDQNNSTTKESEEKDSEQKDHEQKDNEQKDNEQKDNNLDIESLEYQYKDIDNAISYSFPYDLNNKHSTILDIIVIYLKGQKILYTEAKTICEQRLSYLMLPSIFFTAIGSILVLILEGYSNGKIIISSLGGLTTFFLALINYLKLDARAEAHKTSAYKFDKLQSIVEFNSGKILFTGNGDLSKVHMIIEKTQEIVADIKETNQFILPEIIRYSYPTLYSINVFSEVKKIQTKEILYKNHLKDILNKTMNYSKKEKLGPLNEKEKLEYSLLFTAKEAVMKQIISINDEYLLIDKTFTDELQKMQRPYYNPLAWDIKFFKV